MKRRLALTLAVALLALVPLAALTAEAAERKALVAQTYYPPSMALGFDAFLKNVAARLPDRDIRAFHGNAIVSSPQLLDGLSSGVISIGQIITHMYGQIPGGKLFAALPSVTESVEDADRLFDVYGYREFIAEALAAQGLVYLGPTWSAPYHLLTRKPVNSLKDLQGLRIRAIGLVADVLVKLGVTCVNIPPESLSMALTSGDIDGVIFGSAHDYKQAMLYEAAPWYNVTPLAIPVIDSLVVSRKAWDALDESERSVLREEAAKVRRLWYDQVQAQEAALRDSIFKNRLCAFSDADREQFRQTAAIVLREEALRYPAGQKGVDMLMRFMQER
ncbi:MAG TPA: TRAP transporter substrate-binding protein DctP [Candidatus Desulfovibrio intestinavium]|uniref:TRAP transporter substrate-binding protein DctP n=1 Tax=Candidatus Desulfovibrio intestinavium TaxID=2838534 RepID=A0A9D2KPW4_9BACT|nr:TRAP transporter substrate-binding protein DctP [Candidatus Desulfovibrio intestinavium]